MITVKDMEEIEKKIIQAKEDIIQTGTSRVDYKIETSDNSVVKITAYIVAKVIRIDIKGIVDK